MYANTNDAWAVEGGTGCWPFTQLATMAVYSSFNSRNSVMARPVPWSEARRGEGRFLTERLQVVF